MASETRHDAILGLVDAGVGSVPTVDAAAVLAAIERLEDEVAFWRDPTEACAADLLMDDVALVLPLAREVVALRERAEQSDQDLIDAYVAADSANHVAKLATARVALLEGLLRQVVRGGHGSKRMRAMIVSALADGG